MEKGELGERRHGLVSELEGEVLEVGAGTGLNLRHYERADRVVAVEPDAGHGGSPRASAPLRRAVPVEVLAGSAESLPFADETFDTAVVTFVLCSVESPQAALAEVRRVLKPGGQLVLLEHVRGEGRLARWQDRFTPIHRKVARQLPPEPGHAGRDRRSRLRRRRPCTPSGSPGATRSCGAGLQGVAIKTSS